MCEHSITCRRHVQFSEMKILLVHVPIHPEKGLIAEHDFKDQLSLSDLLLHWTNIGLRLVFHYSIFFFNATSSALVK